MRGRRSKGTLASNKRDPLPSSIALVSRVFRREISLGNAAARPQKSVEDGRLPVVEVSQQYHHRPPTPVAASSVLPVMRARRESECCPLRFFIDV